MPGSYPYFGPTGVLGYIDHYRIDEEFALVGEDGDHFLKFRDRPMTLIFSGKANVNNHAHIICDSEACTARWFHYWFMHRDLTAVLSRQGVARYKLTKAGLEELDIWLPSIEEQRQISRVLGTWDQTIGTTERLLANSRKQKQALFVHLLRHSKRWEMTRMSDVSTRIQRQSDGGDYPVLMISASSGFVKQSDMYSRFMAGKSLDSYVLLREGEFAYNKGNSKSYEFGCVYPLDGFLKGLVPHVYVCFSLDEERCFGRFYKYLFEADYLHDQLGALVNTGVRNNGLLNIRPTDFMRTRVPLPPMDDQIRIARILDAAAASIQCIEQSLEKLRHEKYALMQQILTGKRRVHLPESAEAVSP